MNSEKMADIRKRLLLMQRLGYSNSSSQAVTSNVRVFQNVPDLGRHDWGVFGEYEYLGAGTPATRKYRAGIKPVNELDKIAMLHDLQYAATERNEYGPYMKHVQRAMADYGAGSGMLVQSFNPTTSLSFGDRVFGVAAGTGLVLQGVARVFPPTALGMAIADWIFY